MFRIRGILRGIRILGSLDCIPDLDPDPARSVSGLQDASKSFF
jgi:hypothetical protein